jgi:hypothetical protein
MPVDESARVIRFPHRLGLRQVRKKMGGNCNVRKLTSLQLQATADGAIRLIPPAGQAIASVTTAKGKVIPAGADGAMHIEKGASYGVTFR